MLNVDSKLKSNCRALTLVLKYIIRFFLTDPNSALSERSGGTQIIFRIINSLLFYDANEL